MTAKIVASDGSGSAMAVGGPAFGSAIGMRTGAPVTLGLGTSNLSERQAAASGFAPVALAGSTALPGVVRLVEPLQQRTAKQMAGELQ
jgi:hypothetical protein